MRVRLEAAVRALLADESVVGLPDAARLAAVVLLAKGSVEWGVTTLWSGELARWLGVSVSMVSHKVLPPLRARGAVQTREHVNEDGHVVALDLRLEAVARVRHARDRLHPLALTRDELATLLRLCEALFGPGWEPTGKPAIPPGLLAERDRRGHGAATDRLALLLLVLSCREDGWLKLCSGSLKAPELGRGAATLALLLRGGKSKVSPVLAGRVLGRLQAEGLVEVELEDGGNGVPTGKVRLLPVAEKRAEVRAAARKPAPRGTVRRAAKRTVEPVEPPAAAAAAKSEDSREPEAASSSAPESADGDLGQSQEPTVDPEGPRPAEMADGVDDPADSESADFHAPHALVAGVGGCAEEVDGLSGACAVGVTHRRPERAGAREDAQVAGVPALRLVIAGPLRGEQQGTTPSNTQGTGTFGASDCLPTRSAAIPAGLEPVTSLWLSITRDHPRQLVLAAVARELDRLAGWTQPEGALRAMHRRLERRLDAEGGPAGVRDAVAWLLGRGLPQRRQCGHRACDDGFHSATGTMCEGCTEALAAKRARRRAAVRDVVLATPELSFEDRSRLIEQHLSARATAAAEQHVAQLGARLRREAEAAERAARHEAEARVVPCADCGAALARGLCASCATARETQAVVEEYVNLALAFRADLRDHRSCRKVFDQANGELTAAMREAVREAEDQGVADPHGVASSNRFTAQVMAEKIREEALAFLARTSTADAEAAQAWETEQQRYADRQWARAAGDRAAAQARQRSARWLLEERLDAVRGMWAGRPARIPGRP
ncbi:hypothetical protein ACFWXO_05360 [Kitasatospora sp. NPDC059088]|uniref:hypothetical protein n=1 Tax=Kitasatospora sp. NPDC059088 TaxID=3346722 RepID=UPI0036C2A3D4